MTPHERRSDAVLLVETVGLGEMVGLLDQLIKGAGLQVASVYVVGGGRLAAALVGSVGASMVGRELALRLTLQVPNLSVLVLANPHTSTLECLNLQRSSGDEDP